MCVRGSVEWVDAAGVMSRRSSVRGSPRLRQAAASSPPELAARNLLLQRHVPLLLAVTNRIISV